MKENIATSTTPFNIKIPGYKLKQLLGKGGMASVYLAVQESFGRDVAIKILAPDMARDKEFSERFLREAQIVSRLQHHNIVTVYDVGIHQGYHYLSMEYIPGQELREAKYDLSKGEVVRIIKEVAKALDYAHKNGYIHRDVKPENIMLHENGERVVLMDFGIARMTQADMSVTKTGKVIGTPHYMSPEQTKGLTVDHRSDIKYAEQYIVLTFHRNGQAQVLKLILKKVHVKGSHRQIVHQVLCAVGVIRMYILQLSFIPQLKFSHFVNYRIQHNKDFLQFIPIEKHHHLF